MNPVEINKEEKLNPPKINLEESANTHAEKNEQLKKKQTTEVEETIMETDKTNQQRQQRTRRIPKALQRDGAGCKALEETGSEGKRGQRIAPRMILEHQARTKPRWWTTTIEMRLPLDRSMGTSAESARRSSIQGMSYSST